MLQQKLVLVYAYESAYNKSSARENIMSGLYALLDSLEKDKMIRNAQLRLLEKTAQQFNETYQQVIKELALTNSAIRSVRRLIEQGENHE
jgi:hypothetical protein